jgi:RHS repeat-associated protein
MPATGNTTYRWDALGNVTNITYPQRTNSYSYDSVCRLTNMLDSFGTNLLTTSFTWTPSGQLASETSPWTSDTLSFLYSQGHRTNLNLTQTIGSWNQGSTYDAAWRLQSLVSPAGQFGYGYSSANPASALFRNLSLPNAASITNYYDSLARLDYTGLLNYWGHPLDGYGYQNDPWGLRTNIIRQLGLTTNIVTAGYDGIGELASWAAKESNGTARQNEQLAYGFDAAGNLQYRTNGAMVQTFTVNSLNEITNVMRTGTFTETGATPAPASGVTVNGVVAQTYGDFTFARTNVTLNNGNNGFTNIAQNVYGVNATNTFSLNLPTPVNFQSDANGNLTNDGTRSLYFDSENQLTNVTVAGQYQVIYLYDSLSLRRIRRAYSWQSGAWALTNEVHYIYDGNNVIQERDPNNNVLVTYTRALDLSASLQGAGGIGGLLARTDTNGTTYYHSDGSGNVTALMDSNGNMVARYEYDGYGRLIGMWGPMAAPNVYRFSSKEYDAVTGLYYFGGRYYDPVLQRFLNADPIGEAGGVNLYRFCNNNPVNFMDPYGLAYHYYGNPASFPPGMSPLIYGDTISEQAIAAFGDIGGSILNGVAALGNIFRWGVGRLGGSDQDADALLLAAGIPEANLTGSLGAGEGLLADTLNGATKCERAAEAGTIDPALVRFSQNSISGSFKNGGTISDLAASLNGPGGVALAGQIPPIRLVQQDGLLYTLDNRRLAAFSMTDLQVPYQMATPAEISAEWASKFTTTPRQGMGQFITVRPPPGWKP